MISPTLACLPSSRLPAFPPPRQAVDKGGKQTELPDIWLTDGNPWEVKRSDIHYEVAFGGRTEKKKVDGKEVTVWIPAQRVSSSCGD